jgi:hypothetical protein
VIGWRGRNSTRQAYVSAQQHITLRPAGEGTLLRHPSASTNFSFAGARAGTESFQPWNCPAIPHPPLIAVPSLPPRRALGHQLQRADNKGSCVAASCCSHAASKQARCSQLIVLFLRSNCYLKHAARLCSTKAFGVIA